MTSIELDTDDPVEMLRGVTMAFIQLLAQQPNRCFIITAERMAEFPYEDYNLTAFTTKDGGQAFALVPHTCEGGD